MSEQSEVRITVGGDQNGQIVVGDNATVNNGATTADQPTQRNTASGEASVYSVGHGEMHVHHHDRQNAD